MPETDSKLEFPAPSTFSQSSLQDYADCARRFQLRYIERLDWPAEESEPALENERHQLAGQSFHRLAQQYLLGLPAEKLAPLANTPDLRRWWEHFTTDFRSLEDLGSLHPEIALSAPLGKFRLLAKYDLVAISPDGRATIYDWKTYRKRPKDEWMAIRWQTRVYRALLAQAGAHLNGGRPIVPDRIEMVYWYADYPREPARFAYSHEQFVRDWELLEKTVAAIAFAAEFPMTEDEKRCAYCTYRSYCARGTAAGPFDQAEAEMEAEASFDIDFEQVGEIAF
jgi:CRISPR/Cas system-associated exonuclease Cas4 (RecB family)